MTNTTRQALIENALTGAKLSSRDRADYTTMLIEMETRSRNPEIFLIMRAAMSACLMAVSKDIPIKKLRGLVRRGDLFTVTGSTDPEAVITADVLDNLPPEQVALFRFQQEMRDAEFKTAACRAKCTFCCISQTPISAVIAEAEAVWAAIKDKDLGPPIHPKACPALGADGLCGAYDARPMSCRSHWSTDAEACARVLADESLDGDGQHFKNVISFAHRHFILKTLSAVMKIKCESVDLATTLTALRSGVSMDKALSAGASVHTDVVANRNAVREAYRDGMSQNAV